MCTPFTTVVFRFFDVLDKLPVSERLRSCVSRSIMQSRSLNFIGPSCISPAWLRIVSLMI